MIVETIDSFYKPLSVILLTDRRDLTQSFGLVTTKFGASTETATTGDPLGTHDRGRNSKRIDS